MMLVNKVQAAITNSAIPGGSSPDGSPKQFAITIATLWQTIILVGGLAFLLYFLLGGVNWLTAGGDKGKLPKSSQFYALAIGHITAELKAGALKILDGFPVFAGKFLGDGISIKEGSIRVTAVILEEIPFNIVPGFVKIFK